MIPITAARNVTSSMMMAGHIRTTSTLLSIPAGVNRWPWTPSFVPIVVLHCTTHCHCGTDVLFFSALEHFLDITGNQTLNSQDAIGGTLLLWAAVGGHTNTVEMLLNRGADPQIAAFSMYTETDASRNLGGFLISLLRWRNSVAYGCGSFTNGSRGVTY